MTRRTLITSLSLAGVVALVPAAQSPKPEKVVRTVTPAQARLIRAIEQMPAPMQEIYLRLLVGLGKNATEAQFVDGLRALCEYERLYPECKESIDGCWAMYARREKEREA